MREIHHITSLDDPDVQLFSRLTDHQLRQTACNGRGLFIAESPKVILTALQAGLQPYALLCEERHLSGDAAPILERCPQLKVLTGSRNTLADLTGYTLTRGVLCAFSRPPMPTVEEVCAGARRIVVVDGVCDTTNIGAIFRSAAALNVDGIVLTADSCDPLNRRAVRVSMGTVFQVPWTRLPADDADGAVSSYCSTLRGLGLTTVALALSDDALPIDHPSLRHLERMAVIVGTEGDGLADRIVGDADHVACIPMHHQVDSLNVAAAMAVAMWEWRVNH